MAAAVLFRPQTALALPSWENQLRPPQPQATCHNCNRPATLRITSPRNPNGNAGRPYFACRTCQRESSWVCWADTRGIEPTNPCCDCDLPSRQDRIGSNKGCMAGRGFWTCSTGRCGFYSEHEDGTPGGGVGGFFPWLLPSIPSV